MLLSAVERFLGPSYAKTLVVGLIPELPKVKLGIVVVPHSSAF